MGAGLIKDRRSSLATDNQVRMDSLYRASTCACMERERNIARSAKSIYIAPGLGNTKISFPFSPTIPHKIRDGFPPRVPAPFRLCSEEHELMC
jgi:hypothetical protein